LKKELHIALLGNPNSGKTSLFNCITGLNQKVGNFPGVTVEMKSGKSILRLSKNAIIQDLPGSYSLYPRRADEWVSYRTLMNPVESSEIDLYILVADATNLPRNLLYVTQVIDLGKPVLIALTMVDLAKKKGIAIDIKKIEEFLKVPIIQVNPRKNLGIDELDAAIIGASEKFLVNREGILTDPSSLSAKAVSEVMNIIPGITPYSAIHFLVNHESLDLSKDIQEKIEQIEISNSFNHTLIQASDIQSRYKRIKSVIDHGVKFSNPDRKKLVSEKLDNIFLHRRWGYIIMLTVLFIMFQSVFWLAEYPMNAIEWLFGKLTDLLSHTLSENWFTDLFINGVVAGLGGILVFVPQIMILFGMITILEDTGYMARISTLTDKMMRKLGLNGKSVMPMISGFACAVPAIMSARNIENRKERLLTILTTPLMSCSARVPVYTILISLVIPKTYFFGFLSLQGLVMLGLYMLGFVIALIMSAVFNMIIKLNEKSFFILELPLYRPPRWGNVFLTMLQKARIFIVDAGKVIMVISLILWALSSYGPGERRTSLNEKYDNLIRTNPSDARNINADRKAALLEDSYAGIIGRSIEPFIKPIGYDWKIGIALVTSFAAREVFVGTMATLYSVGEEADENSTTLRDKMNAAVRSDGTKVYTLATGVSLMIFYVLAMQCMSTLAIVKKETGSWKWPVIQFFYMTGLAYILSMLAYWLLK
jgi:ferrous iron transport protein B